MFIKNRKCQHILWVWLGIFISLCLLCCVSSGIENRFFSFFFTLLLVGFSGASFWWLAYYFYIPFHKWLLEKGLLLEKKPVYPQEMIQRLDILSENIENLKEQSLQKEKECQQLKLEKEQLEKKCKEAHKQSEASRLLFHQTISNIEHGVCFVGADGNLLPHYSPSMLNLLEETTLAGRSIISLLFPWQPDMKKMDIFKRWLNRVLEGDLKDWKESPVPFSTIVWKKENKGKMLTKNLKIHFAPVVQEDIIKQIIVFLQEVVEKAEESNKNESSHPTLEYAMEILKAEPALRKDFFEHIEDKIHLFEEKQALLQQGTLNRMVILELSNCIKDIKSSARVVKFRSIIQEAEKMETLLNILRTGQKMFRIEQLLEIEERTRKFVEMLNQYHSMGKQVS
ncbi:MAG: hypothetical protein HUU50_16175 [Candidatus Brocadiae bacterium]|nr:hypothetical protein [Candidatus Brocadiia bacterium]